MQDWLRDRLLEIRLERMRARPGAHNTLPRQADRGSRGAPPSTRVGLEGVAEPVPRAGSGVRRPIIPDGLFGDRFCPEAAGEGSDALG